MAMRENSTFDAVIVGAGFAGMYMLHRLRGLGLRAVVLEAGSGVGGTWYWNRYPGARCDVESMEYSYQFSPELQQEWEWSERYAAQPEILRYANHVADRFDLRRDIRFNTRVLSMRFHEREVRWVVGTQNGDITAHFCIMATGCLSSPNKPALKGSELFAGDVYHTGLWPHEDVDFTGKRVAIIGTGSSAVQSIPIIAAQAKQLHVFQRTPNYAVPAHNHPLDPEYQRTIKAEYPALRARAKRNATGIDFDYSERLALETPSRDREQEYETRWQRGGLSFLGAFMDIMINDEANKTAAEFVRSKIRATVNDPTLAELLAPAGTIGCKRLCIDTGYYETFNRPNVTLVDISRSDVAITPTGIVTSGKTYDVDAIVFATGFDAMTGALARIDVVGSHGTPLNEKWKEGPRTYLGLMTSGFPNMFTVTGPGSPSVLTNMLPTIEQHVDWIAQAIAYLRSNRLARIEPTIDAENAWVAHGNELAGNTLRYSCGSWYLGANIPGKPRVFMPYIGGLPRYMKKCREVVENGYEGFVLS